MLRVAWFLPSSFRTQRSEDPESGRVGRDGPLRMVRHLDPRFRGDDRLNLAGMTRWIRMMQSGAIFAATTVSRVADRSSLQPKL